jgi:hypothetical protein
MDPWYALCVYSVFRYRPCDGLTTRSRSPTVCKMIMKLRNQRPWPKGGVKPVKKNLKGRILAKPLMYKVHVNNS